jgi:hypothetical protein
MTALPSFTVADWTGNQNIAVKAVDYGSTSGGNSLIHMQQQSGSMWFQFDMTPEGARSLADALHNCANALETGVDGPDSYEAIWNALQRIDSAAAMLPSYTVKHEGGIEAFAQNIVDAIAGATNEGDAA